MFNRSQQKITIMGQAEQGGVPEHGCHALAGSFAVRTAHDQLGDHRVVVDGDIVTALDTRIQSAARAIHNLKKLYLPRSGHKVIVRVFRIKPDFKGVTFKTDVVLCQWQGLACRNAQLPFHQVLGLSPVR